MLQVMKLALVGFAILASVYCISDMDHIINEVNNAHTTWKAGRNFPPGTPIRYYKTLMGVKKETNRPELRESVHVGSVDDIPAQFDARKQWPECPTISHVLDQGNCGGCWAAVVASSYSDRMCIATEGKFKSPLSVEQLLSCAEFTDGCDGGFLSDAWNYIIYEGLVTGGDYQSRVGCQPYSIPPCDHHVNGTMPLCTTRPAAHTPTCRKSCVNESGCTFVNDIHKASSYTDELRPIQAQKEILQHGPIVATFEVYEDFFTYKSGVYQHVAGDSIEYHAVRLIGWGTQNGTPYWLAVNSWNTEWGDKGLVKILRGKDECFIESDMSAGRV